MSSDCFIIAIDGPSGAGKSTTSRRVADRLGLAYLDSGALYRTVALAALRRDADLDDPRALADLASDIDIAVDADGVVRLDGRDVSAAIRTAQVSQAASRISAHTEVRTALVELQRAAARPPGAVAEGRDMGTVIFPDADLKIFLVADADERARRRAEEMTAGGADAAIDAVKREMAERDRRDSTRAVAPLEQAADAVVVDSTRLAIDEVVDRIVKEALRRRSAV